MFSVEFSKECFEVSQCPSTLIPGIYELGRSILKYTDLRVSKRQVQLDVWPDKVTLTRKGINLTCIKRQNSILKLEIDEPYELQSGDQIFLLVSLYPIIIKANELPLNINGEYEIADTKNNDETNFKKRSREEMTSAASTNTNKDAILRTNSTLNDSSDDEGIILLKKKPKLQEVTNPEPISIPTPVATGHWSGGLLQYLKNPENFGNIVVTFTDELVVIKDKFPKAILHLLILPRINLPNLKNLTKAHIPLLQSMESMANSISKQWMSKTVESQLGSKLPSPPGRQSTSVLIGYHALPSMSQVHLHVISNDFESSGLKTKKHWNSFTSDFFVSTAYIISELQQGKTIEFENTKYEAYLDLPLKCHRCDKVLANMPTLKSHIAICDVGLM